MIKDPVMVQEGGARRLGAEDDDTTKHSQRGRPRTLLEDRPRSRRLLGG